jgi:hypothetical protein
MAGVAVSVAVVSTAAWLVASILLRRSAAAAAALRHAVLLSALIVCMICPAVVIVCAMGNLRRIAVPVFRGDAPVPQPSTTPAAIRLPIQSTPAPHPNKPAAPSPLEPATTPRVTKDEPSAPVIATTPPAAAPGVARHRDVSVRDAAAITMLIWAGGIVLLLLRLAWNFWCIARLRRSARAVEDSDIIALMNEAAASLDIRTPPRFLVSKDAIAPAAVGLWRAAVILPQAMLGVVADDELRAVVAA